MLPDFAASGNSQDRDGSKLIVPNLCRWRSPSSWYSVSTTSRGDMSWPVPLYTSKIFKDHQDPRFFFAPSGRLRLDLLSISKYLRSRAWAWPQDVGIYGGKRIPGAAAAVWLLSLSSQCDRCVNIWPTPDPWKTRNRFWPGSKGHPSCHTTRTDVSGRPKWHPILHHVPWLFPKFFQLVASFRTLWIYIYIHIYIYSIAKYLSIFPHHFLVNSTNFTGPPILSARLGFRGDRGSGRSRRKASPSARCRTSARRARARSCGRGRPSRPSKLWTASTATNACDPGVGGKKGATRRKNWDDVLFWGERF